ncbi:MAG: hypothetical protein AAGD32_17375 [Planctomycetota bacterium]
MPVFHALEHRNGSRWINLSAASEISWTVGDLGEVVVSITLAHGAVVEVTGDEADSIINWVNERRSSREPEFRSDWEPTVGQ